MREINEIINVLEEKYLPSEVVKELKLLDLSSFEEEQLREYALDHDICYECGGELVVHTWKESRGEFWGFPCQEEMSEIRCRDCGEIYE